MDIRWKQRFSNFVKAVDKLQQSIEFIQEHNDFEPVEMEIIKEGLIQRFEYTHELAWNVMKDYAEFQGNPNAKGSRDATREAFRLNLIIDGEIWMDMILSRNKTSHTYNEQTAEEIYNKILNSYFSAFLNFRKNMDKQLEN